MIRDLPEPQRASTLKLVEDDALQNMNETILAGNVNAQGKSLPPVNTVDMKNQLLQPNKESVKEDLQPNKESVKEDLQPNKESVKEAKPNKESVKEAKPKKESVKEAKRDESLQKKKFKETKPCRQIQVESNEKKLNDSITHNETYCKNWVANIPSVNKNDTLAQVETPSVENTSFDTSSLNSNITSVSRRKPEYSKENENESEKFVSQRTKKNRNLILNKKKSVESPIWYVFIKLHSRLLNIFKTYSDARN